MSDSLYQNVKGFLERHLAPNKPIILGLSGGPDSLALFHLLLECKSNLSFDLHIAHIDHGWREESSSEAKILQAKTAELGLSFHLHTLSCSSTNNLEEKARLARFEFFSEIYEKIGAQALFLAHHFDDQSETVLKRVLEGSSLYSMGAMRFVSQFNKMRVLRPLLSTPKEALLSWIKTKGLTPFMDHTNQDTRFLRARLREEILPKLTRSFGKELKDNLIRLSDESFELKQYLERKISPYLSLTQEGPFGSYLDFSPHLPMERVELKGVIKALLSKNEITLSYQSLEDLATGIEKKSANQKMIFKNGICILDRGILFLMKSALPTLSYAGPIKECRIEQDGLEWEFNFVPVSEASSSNWRDVWKGEAYVAINPTDHEFIPSTTNIPYPGASPIKKWWGDHKVPAFFRGVLPLIYKKNRVVHEFFSGKKLLKEDFDHCLQIKIKRIFIFSPNQ